MPLTNAQNQARWRERRNALAKRALELEAALAAGEGSALIQPLPVRHRTRAEQMLAHELVQLKTARRTAKSRRDAAALADVERAISSWEAVRARLLGEEKPWNLRTGL